MRREFPFLYKQLAMAFALGAGLIACGDGPPAVATGCTGDVAQIGVYDGFLEIQCGCTEAAGTVVSSGSSLTCTLPSSSTSVVFSYANTEVPHQMVSVGSPSFTDSPLSDPSTSNPIRAHAFTPPSSGTYQFRDQFNTNLTGQIVVP